MLRIAGKILPPDKPIVVALTYIYGLGPCLSRKILTKAGIDFQIRTKDLPESKALLLRDIIEKEFRVEGALRQIVRDNIKRLKEINSWRGLRHQQRLPVRGQQTRTNSRTIRGNIRLTASGTSSRRSQPSPT